MKHKLIKILVCVPVAYFLLPSYIIAIAIGMPFPNILFPPIGKIFLYDVDNYSCLEQSQETEHWLESHGIHVYGVSGYTGNCTLRINSSTGQVDYNIQGGSGHRWILIQLPFGIKIPFDSTVMLPMSPTWFGHYKVIIKDEGSWYQGYKILRNNEVIERVEVN